MKKMTFTVKCVTYVPEENIDREKFAKDESKGFPEAKESITEGLEYLGTDSVEFIDFEVTEVEDNE